MTSSTSYTPVDYSYTHAKGTDGVISNENHVRKYLPENFVNRSDSPRDWKQRIRNGDNATSSLIGEKWSFAASPAFMTGSIQHKSFPPPSGSRSMEVVGNIIFLGVPTFNYDLSLVSANNQALTRYYSNINSLVSKFSGFVFLGELRESLHLIKHPASALRRGIGDYLTKVKRLGPSVAKRRRLSFVRETWLEYAFGWKPLINDIDNGIKAFYSSDCIQPIFEMVHGRGYDESKSEVPISNAIDLYSSHELFWGNRMTQSVSVHYFGVYQHKGNGIANSHSYGFRPEEFIPSLWELIPYSFLVDYFTNIGDIISSWSYRFLSTKWTACTVRRHHVEEAINMLFRCHPSIDPSVYIIKTAGDPGTSRIEKVRVERSADVPMNLPAFTLEVPGMGSTKWLNLLGLTKQLESTRRSVRL